MGKISSREQYNARRKVFDEFWDNKIDFETFKRRIEEVDKGFRETT